MAETIIQEVAPGVKNTYYKWELNNFIMDKIREGFRYSRNFTFGADAYHISVSKPVAEYVYFKLDAVVYDGYTTYRFKDEASLLSKRHSLISLLETLYWDLDFNKSLYEVNVKPDTLKDFKNQLYIVLESLKGEL